MNIAINRVVALRTDRPDIRLPPTNTIPPPSQPTAASARVTTIRTHYRERVVDIDFIFPHSHSHPNEGEILTEGRVEPSARLSLPPRFSYLPDTSVHTRVTVGVHWVVSWHRIDISIRCCLTSCRLPERHVL